MNRENHIEKDLKGNYLWVNREDTQGEHFEEIVLHEEKIQGFIPFYEIENVGESYLVYRLEYRKNFLQKLERGRIQCSEMESFIKSFPFVKVKIRPGISPQSPVPIPIMGL